MRTFDGDWFPPDSGFSWALRTRGLKMVMGTDDKAGANGRNARETVERARFG